ncbi:MAG TPA: 6,7-dimethyl-8-ribityllumazine synthase [Polyangia bacterium]|jgi:6,7-dimethyl-8-ribityllumazine synthase
MPKIIEGTLQSTGLRFAVVASRFNHFVVERLVDGALDGLRRTGTRDEDITVLRTPGGFEIPALARMAVESGHYDGVICVGAVIRGGTPHFDFIAAEVTKGIAQVAMSSPIPVVYGVITTDTIEQAIERAGTKAGNKGYDAAMTAVELCNLYRQLGQPGTTAGATAGAKV